MGFPHHGAAKRRVVMVDISENVAPVCATLTTAYVELKDIDIEKEIWCPEKEKSVIATQTSSYSPPPTKLTTNKVVKTESSSNLSINSVLSGITSCVDIFTKSVDFIAKYSGVDVKRVDKSILYKPEGFDLTLDNLDDHYEAGDEFRSPANKLYSKILWTDSIFPCGGFGFYIEAITRARPKNTDNIPDGYYIPRLSLVPATRYNYPLCQLSADLEFVKPQWQKRPDGLIKTSVHFDVVVRLVKMGIFDWRSRIKFSLDSDSIEVKLLSDSIASPFAC